ncbi:MAG: cytochrome oxidase Cu insertion factor (SCO1/SenC/PrrC family) [Rhodothermales bacterium]|jgi:cytochrome oxidase Cu insertion factor (SCO1/SenC/PrrC family)
MNFQGPKFTLLAISALFLTPLIIVILMRSSLWNFEPSRFVNRGVLVEPAQSLALNNIEIQYSNNSKSLEEREQWVMLYPIYSSCEQTCLENIAGLRQVHTARGRQRDKVAIWLITPERMTEESSQTLISIYPKLNILLDVSGNTLEMLNSIGTQTSFGKTHYDAGQAFLLDPSANIILRYVPGFDFKDIDQDLDRLLTWSGTN